MVQSDRLVPTRHRHWPAPSRSSLGIAIGLTGALLGILLSGCSAEHFTGPGGGADAPLDLAPSGQDLGDPNAGTGGDSVTGSGGMGSGGAPGSGGISGSGGSGGSLVPPTDAGSGGGAGMDAGTDAPPKEAGGTDAIDAAPVSHPATLTGATPTTLIGNANGGGLFQDDCPSGQALVGFSGTATTLGADGVNRQIAAQCGVIQVVGTTVSLKPGATLPTRGSVAGAAWTRTCPTNQVVVGFSGRLGDFVDQLVFVCAPLSASSPAVGASLAPGTMTTSLTPIGGGGGMAFAAVKCATGELAGGSRVRAGDFLDAFSLICSRANIAP
jgi:hypothetical protein